MNNIFDIINRIYKKEPLIIDKIDLSLCIALTNILRLNKSNLHYLKSIIHYLFYIHPKRYIMLLFIKIPYYKYPPFIKGTGKKKEEKENKLYNKIQYVLDWSNKELKWNKSILDKIIDKDYWKKELAIK